jgi:hypothetical protein
MTNIDDTRAPRWPLKSLPAEQAGTVMVMLETSRRTMSDMCKRSMAAGTRGAIGQQMPKINTAPLSVKGGREDRSSIGASTGRVCCPQCCLWIGELATLPSPRTSAQTWQASYSYPNGGDASLSAASGSGVKCSNAQPGVRRQTRQEIGGRIARIAQEEARPAQPSGDAAAPLGDLYAR